MANSVDNKEAKTEEIVVCRRTMTVEDPFKDLHENGATNVPHEMLCKFIAAGSPAPKDLEYSAEVVDTPQTIEAGYSKLRFGHRKSGKWLKLTKTKKELLPHMIGIYYSIADGEFEVEVSKELPIPVANVVEAQLLAEIIEEGF